MTRRASAILAVVIGVALAAPADADRAKARRLYQEAQQLIETGKRAAALALLDEAIGEDPDLLVVYESAAPLWIAAGRLPQAIAHLERVTTRHPGFAFGWYTLAYAYRKTGRDDLAVLAYETYLGLRPGQAAPFFGLGMARKETGDRAGARDAFRRYIALERDPGRAEYVERARLELRELGGTVARDPRFDRAASLIDRGRLASAAAALDAIVVTTARGAAERARLRARIAELRGHTRAARAYLAWALALAPTDLETLRAVAP